MNRTPCRFRWRLLPRVRFVLKHRVYRGVTVNKPPTWKMNEVFLTLFFPCILPSHLKLAFKSHLLLKRKEEVRGTPETKGISLIFIFSIYCWVTTRPYFHFSQQDLVKKNLKNHEKGKIWNFFSVYIRGLFFFVYIAVTPINLIAVFKFKTKRPD